MGEIRKHPVYDIKVSSCGKHVWSLDRLDSIGRLWKGRKKKISLTGTKAGWRGQKYDNRYRSTNITHEGKSLRVKMAQLVADTFLPPRPMGYVLRHGPNGQFDDSVANLSYGTKKQDRADTRRDGTANRGAKNGRSKLTDSKALAIRASSETQRCLAKKYGVSRSTISYIKRKKSWSHI